MDELDRVRVSSPCPLAQDPVGPGGGHCAHCRETVVDLSRMPRSEAMARVRAGARCVRMELGADGRVMTLVRAAAVATSLAACAVQPGGADPVESAVDSGPPLLLRVVNRSGAPIVGANVHELDPPPDGVGPPVSSLPSRTDERGEAQVRPGRGIWVEAPGYEAVEATEVEVLDGVWQVRLLKPEEREQHQWLRVIGYVE